MQRIAVFPGSFDPITIGHQDIIRRAAPLFDKVVVAIGINSQKKYMYSLEQRKQWLENAFSAQANIEVDTYEGLTVHFCQKIGAQYMLRGLRNATDFSYEKNIAQMNYAIGAGIETIFLISQPVYSHISSSLVRVIIKGGEDVSAFLPQEVKL